MSAADLLKEGRLDDAVSALQDAVRANPADSKERIFLFQLLAVQGQWDRALRQLNVLGELDASTLAMVQAYRGLLVAEHVRRDVFSGRRSPVVFGEPDAWIALMIEALRAESGGARERAADVRAEALDGAPTSAGSINGEPFAWIADADSRLGPILEVVLGESYTWVPFHCVSSIELEAPEDLRDLVWAPAQFVWTNGGQSIGMIPARYIGSEEAEDAALRLSRRTEWVEATPDCYHGVGQRLLTTDRAEYPLLEARTIAFEATGGEA